VPRHALISLAVPPTLELRWVDDLYYGLEELSAAFGVTIVGGNLATTTGPIVVDVTVLGEVEEDLVVRRTGAREGDRLLVTGTLGAPAAALLAWEARVEIPERDRLLTAHRRPRPRVHEGRVVSQSRWATAMIDLSDGLATDLTRLCDANGLGVRLEADALPVDPGLYQVAHQLRIDALDLALRGGEEYELLVAAPPAHAQALAERIRTEVGTAATVIGEFVPAAQGRAVECQGRRVPLLPTGWDHFRQESTADRSA